MDDKLGLNNLSERELLLLLNERMSRLENFGEKLELLEIKVRDLETRLKIWATVISIVGSLAGSGALKLIANHF